MTDEEKAIDLTSQSFELEKDNVEWFCSTYKNSRMSEIHTFYNGVLVGLAEGRKEGYEQGILKDCLKVACPNCKPSVDNYCINCEYANFIIDKDNQIYKLEKENAEFKEALKSHSETASVTQLMELIQVREENEKLKAQIINIKEDVENE